ncbi:hypothetical protein RCL1_007966 [Eukaryota sp. TZLM3-RCL]
MIKAISITLAVYESDDIISLLCAFIGLIPFALLCVWFYLAVIRQESFALAGFIGLFINDGLSVLLKALFKAPRPLEAVTEPLEPLHLCPRSDFGFPSSHAQFIAFWCILVCYNTLFLYKPLNNSSKFILLSNILSQNLTKYFICFCCFLVTFMVGISRIYISCHDLRQVIGGWLFGWLIGICYVLIINKILVPIFQKLRAITAEIDTKFAVKFS